MITSCTSLLASRPGQPMPSITRIQHNSLNIPLHEYRNVLARRAPAREKVSQDGEAWQLLLPSVRSSRRGSRRCGARSFVTAAWQGVGWMTAQKKLCLRRSPRRSQKLRYDYIFSLLLSLTVSGGRWPSESWKTSCYGFLGVGRRSRLAK